MRTHVSQVKNTKVSQLCDLCHFKIPARQCIEYIFFAISRFYKIHRCGKCVDMHRMSKGISPQPVNESKQLLASLILNTRFNVFIS